MTVRLCSDSRCFLFVYATVLKLYTGVIVPSKDLGVIYSTHTKKMIVHYFNEDTIEVKYNLVRMLILH